MAKGGQTFPVPLAILAAQSEPLRRATTGPESQQRRIDLQDWDADTVNQLVSFLYRGTYEGPSCSAPLATVLLDHAKVYALAQCKGVEALRQLALGGIKDGLEMQAAREIYSGAVVELLRYVYSHTQFLENSKEPLRELVACFAADGFQRLFTVRMVELFGDPEFVDFRLDVLFKICERLGGMDEKLQLEKREKEAALKAREKAETALLKMKKETEKDMAALKIALAEAEYKNVVLSKALKDLRIILRR